MALVVPKINTQGRVFEHVTLLEPRDFMFFTAPDYDAYTRVKENHANVGSLEDIDERFKLEARSVLDPLWDALENMLLTLGPKWFKDDLAESHISAWMAFSNWHTYELKVDPKGTFGLTLGCAWAEAPKLWGSDLWTAGFQLVNWHRLWEELV